MKNPSLTHSRYSVENAKRNIEILAADIAEFEKCDPYGYVKDFDPTGPYDIFKLKLIKPLPMLISGIAFDAANNLRSALDQAGFAVAIASNTNGKQAKFPFGDTIENVRSLRQRSSRDIPESIFAVMVDCKPYIGGDDYLWALNKICNSQKHETIVPTGIYPNSTSISFGPDGVTFPKGFSFPPTWDSTKNEMILAVLKHLEHGDFNMKGTIIIAFGKAGFLSGKPAVPVLRKMALQVECALNAIETAAREAGIFP